MTPELVNQVLNSSLDIHSYIYGLIAQEKTQEIEEILLYKPFLNQINIEWRNDTFLRLACSKNNIPLISLFLTHPKIIPIKIKNEYPENIFNPLVTACYSGHLNVVKYLLTHPKLINQFDINAQNNIALKFAINQNHTEVVKYLLTSEVANQLELESILPDLISVLSYNIQYNNFGDFALSYLLELCEKRHISLTEYEDETYGTTLLDMVVQCNSVELTKQIFPFFDQYPHLQKQAVRHSISQKAFQSAYYMMVEKEIKIYYEKSRYSDKDIVAFLEKYELYEKYHQTDGEGGQRSGGIRKI